MQHYFDVEIAKEYGILEAILVQNFQHWIAKNEANNKNFYDGYYWTFNSTRAFNELFPYVSERQIKNALKHLRDEGILQTGNYNKVTYDRTLWYSFTDKGKSIVQKCPMDSAKMSNGKVNNVPPIPDNKPNGKTNNNTIINNSTAEAETMTTMIKQIIDYMNNCGVLENFKIKKTFSFNPKANSNIKIIKARINEDNTLDDFKDVIYHTYDKFVENEFKGLNGKSSIQYYRPSTLFSSENMEKYKNEYKNL